MDGSNNLLVQQPGRGRKRNSPPPPHKWEKHKIHRHSNGANFSCEGLKYCINFFLKRNHKVLAFIPRFRKTDKGTKDPEILEMLERQGLVSFTPSCNIDGKLVVSYDDRFIVQYAAECGAVIVSRDNFKDLMHKNPTWKETIEKRWEVHIFHI